jgi:hypothetical protein
MSNPRNNPSKFWHPNRNLTYISGNWTVVGGVGAVDVVTGNGFAVARTALGVYTITFTDAFSDLITAHANVACITAANLDLVAQLGPFTPGAAGAATLIVRAKAIGANTEVAATDSVHFDALLYGEPLD